MLDPSGLYVGRCWNPQVNGPSVFRVRHGLCEDITSPEAPTVRDIFERQDCLDYVRAKLGLPLDPMMPLAPCDLQAIKAAEITGGAVDPHPSCAIDIHSKSQPMGCVGDGTPVGLNETEIWSFPQPKIALAVNSRGHCCGVSLGHFVNAPSYSDPFTGNGPENTADTAIGPLIRLFDDTFTLDDLPALTCDITIKGTDGLLVVGTSEMRNLACSPMQIVRQSVGAHQQYPDGLMLCFGVPCVLDHPEFQDAVDFSYRFGDTISVAAQGLGVLTNAAAGVRLGPLGHPI